jgi:nucleoside-diphosphate-sugar epimerase|tara:strand:+ start:349 stop:1209 length:861 start_codon:yes stop_codon:yes gene_type:complete
MKILVTGCDGNIGKQIAKNFLLKKIKNILLLFNNKNKKKNNKNKIYKDLTKPLSIKSDIDTIIHCAGMTPNSKMNNMKKIYSLNLKIIKNIINFANKNNVKKIIFFSTIDIYGSNRKNIINEDDLSIKPNLYAKSKIASEKLLCNKKNKFKSICLRLPGFLNPKLNKDYPILIKLIKKIKKNQKIEVYSWDKKFNNIIDIDELLRFINFIKYKKLNSQIFNFSASNPIYFIDLINIIRNKFKSKSIILKNRTKKKSFVISNKKLHKILKFKTSSTKKIINRFLKNI